MRLLVVVVLAACATGSADHRMAPAPPVPIANETRGCGDAAAGLENATRGLHPPEESMLSVIRTRCLDDTWSGGAIDCFATMKDDDLGRCAAQLATAAREQLFAELGGATRGFGQVAIAKARLSTLKVGIAECDRFVAAVSTALSCEGMPLDARLQLGSETADFWSLPTQGLSLDAQQRMARVCGVSLASLVQQVSGAGCTP